MQHMSPPKVVPSHIPVSVLVDADYNSMNSVFTFLQGLWQRRNVNCVLDVCVCVRACIQLSASSVMLGQYGQATCWGLLY
jgi:hypothetical protein